MGYSILVPIFVGFTVGPRCLMGVLAGALVVGCMLAILMSNAGGAWDNSKKLCEKLQIKKTDIGKACIVGDTVGDPFKDTSGPSLNILLKLMAMVALLFAPVMDGREDWTLWWIGLIIAAVGIISTLALIYIGILTWKDPLVAMDAQPPKKEGITGEPVDASTDAAKAPPPAVEAV